MIMNFNIAIAGSGLTGLCVSLSMAKLGYKIALIDPISLEKLEKGNRDSRTTALSIKSVIFLKKINVLTSNNKNLCPIKNILIQEPSINASSYLNKIDKENTLGYMIQNKVLINHLVKIVKKNKNIFKIDERILNFNREKDHINITLSNNRRINSKLLIGADGKNSFVRKLSGIKFYKKDYGQKAFTFNIKHKYSHKNIAVENFLEKGPLAALPIVYKNSNFYSSIVWSCNFPHHFKVNNDKKYFKSFLKKNLNDFYGDFQIVSEIKDWDLKLINSKEYVSYRVLLIGEAAHSIHPLAGQGFNLTLKGLERLYFLFKEDKNKQEDVGNINRLLKYYYRHYVDAKALIFATDNLNTLFSNTNPVLKVIRRNGIKLFNKNKLIKNLFKNYASKGQFRVNSH